MSNMTPTEDLAYEMGWLFGGITGIGLSAALIQLSGIGAVAAFLVAWVVVFGWKIVAWHRRYIESG